MTKGKKYLQWVDIKRSINFILNTQGKFKKTKLLSRPLFLDITPTKYCNLNCIHCIRYPALGTEELSLDNFNRIAKKLFPYANLVQFCCGGEPFLNKNFVEFLSICNNYRINIRVLTNGTLLSEDICKKVLANDYIKEIGFSLDGFNKKTVESIRLGIDYQKVIDNIRLMAHLKRINRQRRPLLAIRCTVMKRNIEELPDLIRHASYWGIDKVFIHYLNVANNIDRNESLFYHPQLTKCIFDEAYKISKLEKVQLKWPAFTDMQDKVKFCDMPWTFIKIDTAGSVRFCHKAWKNPVGNIFEQNNFFDLWNNIHYQLIRKTVNTDKPYFKYCSICAIRNGYGREGSHLKDMQRDFYEFTEE